MMINGGLRALWNDGNIGTRGTLGQGEHWDKGNIGIMETLEQWEHWDKGNVEMRGTVTAACAGPGQERGMPYIAE